jgi:hypothetical protein
VWHELAGPERYFILSKHGVEEEFFVKEQRRVWEAVTKLRAEAETLGAIQVEKYGFIDYEAPQDASEAQKAETKARVAVLLSPDRLRRYHVSLKEVHGQSDFMCVLNSVLRGSQPS